MGTDQCAGAGYFSRFILAIGACLLSSFSAMPIQIFNWTSRPQAEFQQVAATGILVLLMVLLTMNAIAVLLRHRFGGGNGR